MFTVAPLNWTEWKAVVCVSFPVIIVDEVLKYVSRRMLGLGRRPSFRFWRRDPLPRTGSHML